jgi:roadblock/LC7 domain-containing protein
MVSFAPDGKYLLLKGRFDWKSLHTYVADENGQCYNLLCRMAGSAPERQISFFPVQSGLMALAVSADDGAALRMSSAAPGPAEEAPDAPVWLSIPPSVLKSSSSLPDGARMFARGMERAESVTLGFAPQGGRIVARLSVRCRNPQDASDIAAQLTGATTLLQEMIAREHQRPNPADLSGVLAAGSFHGEGRRVVGYWPIDQAFVESVLAP